MVMSVTTALHILYVIHALRQVMGPDVEWCALLLHEFWQALALAPWAWLCTLWAEHCQGCSFHDWTQCCCCLDTVSYGDGFTSSRIRNALLTLHAHIQPAYWCTPKFYLSDFNLLCQHVHQQIHHSVCLQHPLLQWKELPGLVWENDWCLHDG